MSGKNKKRTVRRDEAVDALRTIWWFQCLSTHLETNTPREVQRAIAPHTVALDINGEPIKNNKFLGYSKGRHVPSKALQRQAEAILPKSSWILSHPIWLVLKSTGSIKDQAVEWIRQLDREVQSIVLQPYNEVVIGASRHTLGALERRASLDSLAALTILLKLHHEDNQPELVWLYAQSIFRVMLLIGTSLDRNNVAGRMFQLYVERVFSLAVFEGKRMDLSNYDYVFAANHLAGIADRVRDKHASERDRRMPTFYALQALTGIYQQRFKKYFQIPLVAITNLQKDSHK